MMNSGSRRLPLCQAGLGVAGPPVEEDQPPDVVGEVGEADLHLRPRDSDGSDAERHRPFLVREDMLDGGADLGAAGVATPDVGRYRPTSRLTVVDLALKAIPLHERLIRLRAVGAVGPDGRAGVALVEQTAAQHPPVMGRGIGHLPPPDEAVPPVDAGMALVAEDRDGDVGVTRAVLAFARLAEHQRPARVAVLLAQLRRLGLPVLRDAPALTSAFSAALLRCFGAETRLASTIWPDMGM